MAQFEKQLERLEEISASIKKSDISMEEALGFFEEGIQLAKKMEKDLEKIETKIQVLMNAPVRVEDKPELDLFSLSAN
ncbi:MAG TPA: exodeoxyribonuclease VII small subunit [Treponemataceae bacterium]|mgnify:FL=1|nr:exodeoxyribonuclease VII small subunit [Treponema sp.]HOF11437.1 exodeoxyribonuclease VII small subunit [Treponemataceae bacterium]HPM06353.1 exodeoxyribonuclease VII small subunit [Treponemataceae bacterium]HQC26539.1 exodeoxyribonuclease VII small subunit [Treponemataceae bacterium]